MNMAMLGLLAETAVHPGAGRGLGVVDLPVAREASTGYPVLVGSSLKGALRDKAEAAGRNQGTDIDRCFGKPDHAGDLLVSDGRLLLLPVRSLTASYRWVTCPHLVERYGRDLARASMAHSLTMPQVKLGHALAAGDGSLFLEERQFTITGEPGEDLAKAVEPLVLHEETQRRLAARIVVLHDDDFAWFARYGLSIQARNDLEDRTKKSRNLWYEETLPPDTVLHALVAGRRTDALDALNALFPESDPYLQAGGNETVGQGWFAVRIRRDSNGG